MHGSGGTGFDELGKWIAAFQRGVPLAALADQYIIVAPDGVDRRWAVVGEGRSDADVVFVASTLVEHLASFVNVRPIFDLFGTSNGAALVNRILIDNDDTRIRRAVTSVSQLNTAQFQSDGAFHKGGSTNAYTEVKRSLTRRAVLSLVGAQDPIIPAEGGASRVGISFLPWQDSAHAFALAYGHVGPPAVAHDSEEVMRVEYLDGTVQAACFKAGKHGLVFQGPQVGHRAQSLLAAFLLASPLGLGPVGQQQQLQQDQQQVGVVCAEDEAQAMSIS